MPNELKLEETMPEGAVIEALELRSPHDAVCRYALALLRGKDAILEMGAETIERQDKEIAKKDVEIERLHASCTELTRKCASLHAARVEAITEFAERLKRFYSHLGGKTVGGSVEYHIEQVAKEMKGEENG